MTIVAHSGAGADIAAAGASLSLAGDNAAAQVLRTRQAARKENYADSPGAIAELIRDIGVHSAVGAPIVVAGQLWGVTITLWRREHAPPGDTEERMVQFAELLGTAIANADSRDQLTASRARLVSEADQARRRVVRDLHDGELPAQIEASAYFIVAEALTNMMKHSHASQAEVTATVDDGVLQVDVRDDGTGGADPDGRGLVRMADRVSALGGELTIDSPAGCGTRVSARFPLSGAGAAAALDR